MTVYEFRGQMYSKLDKFVRYWLEQHAKDAENFPIGLPNAAEWLEQLASWEQSNEV
jgi:hypothetical protein